MAYSGIFLSMSDFKSVDQFWIPRQKLSFDYVVFSFWCFPGGGHVKSLIIDINTGVYAKTSYRMRITWVKLVPLPTAGCMNFQYNFSKIFVSYVLTFVCTKYSREHLIGTIIKHKHTSLTSYEKLIFQKPKTEASQKDLKPRY